MVYVVRFAERFLFSKSSILWLQGLVGDSPRVAALIERLEAFVLATLAGLKCVLTEN